MWVLLRLLAALIAGLLKFLWRRTTAGDPKQTGAIAWWLYQQKHKGRTVATRFGVRLASPIFFRLTREGGFDRFFKRIGFTTEIQTGDEAFDRGVYVSCDHPALAPVLQADASARAAVLVLFSKGVRTIVTDGEYLWADRQGDTPPDEATLAELARLQTALLQVPAEHLRMLRDRFFWRALVVESVAWGVAFYGVPAIFQMATREEPLYFDWTPVIVAGLAAGVVGFSLLFALSWRVLRGSSRSHRVLTESAVLLALGVPFSAVELVSDANIILDRSEPMIVERTVERTYTTTSRRRRGRTRTHYHVQFAPAPADPHGIPRSVQVRASLHRLAAPGVPVEFVLREGALGFTWVETLRLKR